MRGGDTKFLQKRCDESGPQLDERRLPFPSRLDPIEPVVVKAEAEVEGEVHVLADEGILAWEWEQWELARAMLQTTAEEFGQFAPWSRHPGRHVAYLPSSR